MNIRDEIGNLREHIIITTVLAGIFVGFSLMALSVVWFTPGHNVSSSMVFYVMLVVALTAAAVGIPQIVSCLQISKALLRNYDNSSGLHSWRELPKCTVLTANDRLDEYATERTVLSLFTQVVTSDTDSGLQYFFFDRLLPGEIHPMEKSASKIIILDSLDQLLHKDFKAGVIVLLTKDLERYDKTPKAREVSESMATVPVREPA